MRVVAQHLAIGTTFTVSVQEDYSMTVDEKWLREWEAIMNRIESIDARLWQGAGILLLLSVGGISLLGWHPPVSRADFISAVGSGVFSLLVLAVWWFIFHRWIHLQRIYSYRAREIEAELELRLNRYARLFEYWEDETAVGLDKKEFKNRYPDAYERFQEFWENQQKRRFSRLTIQWALRLLTLILVVAWVAFVLAHAVGLFWPTLLGLQ
jgi:hypothetical protein